MENRNWMFIKLENVDTQEIFWLGNVYGPTLNVQKDHFWDSLEEQIDGKKILPCYIAGDFNVTISPEERRGGTKVMDPYGERLEDLISLWNLTDIVPKNGTFTWSNKRMGPGHIAARLDRFLVSTHLLRSYPETKLLCSSVSDHKPICLFFPPVENLGPLPFKFNRIWLEMEGVYDLISQAWRCFIPGSPAYAWEQKLKKVKEALKQWVKNHYCDPTQQKEQIIKDMESLQNEMETCEITKEHFVKEIEMESTLQKILRQEEEGWRLRSRLLWLKGGDQNTKYFQNQCKERQRWNTMRELKAEDGTLLQGQAAITNEVRNFFEQLYTNE